MVGSIERNQSLYINLWCMANLSHFDFSYSLLFPKPALNFAILSQMAWLGFFYFFVYNCSQLLCRSRESNSRQSCTRLGPLQDALPTELHGHGTYLPLMTDFQTRSGRQSNQPATFLTVYFSLRIFPSTWTPSKALIAPDSCSTSAIGIQSFLFKSLNSSLLFRYHFVIEAFTTSSP